MSLKKLNYLSEYFRAKKMNGYYLLLNDIYSNP